MAKNEPRLIDSNLLTEEIASLTVTVTGLRAGKGVLYEYMKQYRDSVLRIIDEQPTVDAAPVVHGHWKPHHMVPGFVVCSACCDCITYDDWPSGEKWKYCPHCGAKLDAKEADHGKE